MHLNNLVKLHARAGRIVYGLPWDTSAEDVLMRTGWDSLEQNKMHFEPILATTKNRDIGYKYF